MVKHAFNFKEDFLKIRHIYSDASSCDDSVYREQRAAIGDRGVICLFCVPPGLQNWVGLFNGNLEALTCACYDYPDLFEEFAALCERATLQRLEMALDRRVDSILTGGSGSITLQSPELFCTLSLPAIAKITRLCRQAGIICGIHCCGKERALVQACAEETELDYVNPLEPPLMGDCDMAECKRTVGHRLALMGNLHTTSVMLLGSERDTPFENSREMVRVCREFGTHPLDIGRIREELDRLERRGVSAGLPVATVR